MPENPNPKLHVPSAEFKPKVMPNDVAYAELGVTTNFSFLRGASHADELVVQAASLGYRAIGITDLNSLAGVVRMHVAAKEVGLKLIVGSRLQFKDHSDLLVWPVDRNGYGELCALLTLGKRRTGKGECDLSIGDFFAECKGVHAAIVPGDFISEAVVREADDLKDALGRRLSIAASCTYESDNQSRLEDLVACGRRIGVSLLATNDVHYHVPGRRKLQDILTCIRHGCAIGDAGLRLFQNGERYLKTPQQMHALFRQHPQAIARGLEIAQECFFNLDELRYEYPDELAPTGSTALEYLTARGFSP